MDGKELVRSVLDNIDAQNAAAIIDKKWRIYECLDEAAAIFLRETRILHNRVSLTSVAGQQSYSLPPDFIDLYLTAGNRRRYFIKYNDTEDDSWPVLVSYESIVRDSRTIAQDIPNCFCLRDKYDADPVISGTTTAAGAQSRGQCILTDSTKLFTTTHRIWPRYVIHNETDNSDGIVLSVTDATHLVAALSGGGKDAWTSGDAYRIQPTTDREIYLDAPSAQSGHTMTVEYVCMPSPVYSDYGVWRFPYRVCRAIAAGAASLLVIPEGSYNEARVMQGQFSEEVHRYKTERAQQVLSQARTNRPGW
jgi:hypothetical protein